MQTEVDVAKDEMRKAVSDSKAEIRKENLNLLKKLDSKVVGGFKKQDDKNKEIND